MKPLIVDLPYPSTDTLTHDVRSGQIISFAYATLQSELTATLQYIYHHFYFDKIEENDGETLLAIAKAEMMHLDILGTAMLALGVSPRYVQVPNSNIFYNTSTVSCSITPQKMLMDDIQGEMNTIANYQKMLFILKNEQVEAIIQRIILDEQLHLEKLKEMLKKYAN